MSPSLIALSNDIQRRGEALKVNISAGEGLQDVLKSNLGPTGTIKMYSPFAQVIPPCLSDLGW